MGLFFIILFNFEGLIGSSKDVGVKWKAKILIWGCSSAGRAPALHAGGQEFNPPHLHHKG